MAAPARGDPSRELDRAEGDVYTPCEMAFYAVGHRIPLSANSSPLRTTHDRRTYRFRFVVGCYLPYESALSGSTGQAVTESKAHDHHGGVLGRMELGAE